MQRDSRIIAAILAADVVEYSRLMGADEAGTLAALKARRAIFEEVVRDFGGREFGSVGDSLMAEFHSAVNAVSAALAIQERVGLGNAALPPARRMMLRIGVHLGDVIEEQAGVFGDAVNVAARLQALARPGGIMVSGPIREQVHHKVPARYLDAGTRQVKNIDEPVHAYEVLPPEPPGALGRITGALSHLAARRVRRSSSPYRSACSGARSRCPRPASGSARCCSRAPPRRRRTRSRCCRS
jgi:class 3 adenylate cyclase